MQLNIRQRFFSWTDSYDVYDETGEARFYVKAEAFTWGHKIHVFDKRSGREVGSLREHLLSLTKTFDIVQGGREMGTVRKRFTFLNDRYEVNYLGWEVEGDFLGWDYRVMDGNRQVMSISKELFQWTDTYVLRYEAPADEIPGLLLVIAIDAANCGNS